MPSCGQVARDQQHGLTFLLLFYIYTTFSFGTNQYVFFFSQNKSAQDLPNKLKLSQGGAVSLPA
jgi:hypothetical protein